MRVCLFDFTLALSRESRGNDEFLAASERYAPEFYLDESCELSCKVSKEHSNWLNILQPGVTSNRMVISKK